VAAGVAFAKVAKDAIDAADNFAKLSKKVGISVESLSALEFAAKISGTSLDSMKIGLTRLAANATDASMGIGEATAAFDSLQISTTGAAGEIKPMETLLLEVADRFAEMEDGTEKTALAMDIFGKSGTDLIPMLNAGSEGIQEMKDRAEELGIVISTKTAEQSERFNDALLELSSAFQGIVFSILDSGLLESLVDLAEWMAAGSASSTDFSLAGEALTFALDAVQIAVLSLQLAFNLLVLGLLKGMQAVNNLLGSWSPFKDLTEGLAAATDQYNEKLVAGAERIDKIWKGTKKLTEEVKKADTATKKQTKSLGALAKSAKEAADKEKKLVDELKDYVTKAKQTLRPTADVTRHYNALRDAGVSLKGTMLILDDELDAITAAFAALGEEIPAEIQALIDLKASLSPITPLMRASRVEIDMTTDAVLGLARGTTQAIAAENAHDDALKRMTGGVADAEAALDDLGSTTGSTTNTIQGLGSEFSNFLGGIDPRIIPGIGRIKSAFDSVMGTVNGFISSLNSILGLFGSEGIGGIDFGNFFGGGDGGGIFGGGGSSGGGTPTASFTELAITGVAIQTGIFGTGVGISGVTIQKGEFHTGVEIVGLKLGGLFGGGGKDKEIAFNTRLILGWTKDHFPIVDASNAVRNALLNTIAMFSGFVVDTLGVLDINIGNRLDTLIGIQRDRIAPAVEGIRSRLDTTLNVNISQPLTVNVSGSGATAIASAVGSSVASQNRSFIAMLKNEIKTNKSGLRKVIQDI